MIGVIVKESENKIVDEFFELFKTHWEFYKDNGSYDVIVSTREDIEIEKPYPKLLIVYGSRKKLFDDKHSIQLNSEQENAIVRYKDNCLPIYGKILTFGPTKNLLLSTDKSNKAVGIKITQNETGTKICRLGYDLFQEIEFLLMSGQPPEYSHIPTVDLHISILRDMILNCGIPLVEIPPVPHGYAFTVCLTHDVDFIDIRSHKFDHSVIGFICRVIFPRYLNSLNLSIAWSRFLRNWKALISLPGVYAGFFRDFWFDIDRYMEIEKDKCSTFYFIPFKDQVGEPFKNKKSRLRAARYDILNYKNIIGSLLENGHEIGLHGIDAWCDPIKGINEYKVIRQLTGNEGMGVRMHWLYLSKNSPEVLEETGFIYDSTLGYNDTVGYLSGTTQVFRFLNSLNLFELPLNIMDTSLFYSKRMKITEPEAFRLCKGLIIIMRTYGGVFTINWHTRSLSPERNWDDFYIELIKTIEDENVWFASAMQAVNWFKKRRTIHFDDVNISCQKATIKISSENIINPPYFTVRIYYPKSDSSDYLQTPSLSKKSFIDLPWFGESEIEHSFIPNISESVVS